MFRFSLKLCVLWLSIAIGPCLAAASYYVSPSGSDLNPGTLQLPWQTLAHAVAQGGPNTTIYVRAGLYHESFAIQKSGLAGQPLVLTNYPGERPVIDENNTQGFAIVIQGAYTEVSGFEIRNCKSSPTQKLLPGHSYGAGILVAETHDCMLRNNIIHHIIGVSDPNGNPGIQPIGIRAEHSSNVTVQSNTIYEIAGEGEAMGIEMAGGESPVVRKNLLALCDKEGVRIISGELTTTALTEGNIAVYCNLGIDVNSAWSTQKILLSNNFSGFNYSRGMNPKHTTPVVIDHNTLYKNGSYGWDMHGGPPANGGFTDSAHCDNYNPVVTNNILAGNEVQWWMQIGPNNNSECQIFNERVDYNLYQGLAGRYLAQMGYGGASLSSLSALQTVIDDGHGPYEAHGVQADPLFNNPDAGDFTLAHGSPAAGRATDGTNLGADPALCSSVGATGAFSLANVFAVKRLATTIASFSSQTAAGPASACIDGFDDTYWEINPAADSDREIVFNVAGGPREVGFITLRHYPASPSSIPYDYKQFQVFVDNGSGNFSQIPDAPEHPFVGFCYTLDNGESWSLPANTMASRIKIKIVSCYGSTIRIPEIMLYSPMEFSIPQIATAAAASPNPAAAGQTVGFSVAAQDTPGATLTYTWHFGDGSVGSGASCTHSYAAQGIYGASVTVSDENGNSASSAISVTVVNSEPVVISAASAAPNPALSGESITFSVAAADPSNYSLSYAWSFGDGAAGSGSSVTHSYTVQGNYTASVTISDGHGGSVTSTVSVNVSLGSPAAVRIDSGGPAAAPFAADHSYSGGYTYSTTKTIAASGVSNPAPQAVYQTERYGNVTYTINNLNPGATYTVRLHFAEIYWNSAGRRLFNVSINGQQVLANFDIYAAAGGNFKATVKEFSATATNGQIVIVYSTIKDNAKSSGIEVLPVAGTTVFAENMAVTGAAADTPLATIDLGSFKATSAISVPVPLPDSGAAARKLHWTPTKRATPPHGMRLSRGKLLGTVMKPGEYLFELQLRTPDKCILTNRYSIHILP